MTLLILPHELVERILLWLATESVQTCRLVNRELNDIIQSSTALQYFQACEAAGVIDNPQSPLSYAERLEALAKHEDAWRNLKPVFETTIKGNRLPSSMSYFTAGAYFIDDNNKKDVHYCYLPSSSEVSPRWFRIPAHGSEKNWSGRIVDMGIAAYEHDLIVNAISSELENQADMQRYSLDLVLLKISTGQYHPLARHPRIHVQRSCSSRPWITVQIVGDNLALVVHSEVGTFSDKLFIFDWKTGYKRLQHDATDNAYSGLVFVSPEILLIPNLLCYFEVWHLPPSHLNSEPPVQILSLQIPKISLRSYVLFYFSCCGEPSPFPHSIPYFPPRPFFPSPENSIIIANLEFESHLDHRRAAYTLIMHRRALLDTIQKWTSSSLVEQEEPTLLTNEVTVHTIADPDDESDRLVAHSKFDSMAHHLWSSQRTRGSLTSATSATSPTFHISADSGSSSVSSGVTTSTSTSRYDFPLVRWVDWGPSISRWFQVSEAQARLIATSTGLRYPFSVPNPRDGRKLMVSVADFNSHNLWRNSNAETMARLRGEDEDSSSNGKNERRKEEGKEEEEEWEIFDHEGVFSEEVCMGLKCVVYPTPGEYDFDGVLIDEERLIGLKLDPEGWIESVKVLYIG